MRILLITTILFSFLSVSARDIPIKVYPIPRDENLTKSVSFIPALGDIYFSTRFLMSDEWVVSPFTQMDGLSNSLMGQPLLLNDDSHMAVIKLILTVNRPVTDFNRETMLNPNFHRDANPSINILRQVSGDTAPLAFLTSIQASALSLKATLKITYADQTQIAAVPKFQEYLLSQYSKLPESVSIRYTNDVDQVLNSLMTLSQFYDLDGKNTLVVSWLFMNIKNSKYTTSWLMQKPFRMGLENGIQKLMMENINYLYQFRN